MFRYGDRTFWWRTVYSVRQHDHIDSKPGSKSNIFLTEFLYQGYITQKKEERPNPEGEPTYLLTNIEFHPLRFAQHENLPFAEYETFDRAVDEFFSASEGQKIDMKVKYK